MSALFPTRAEYDARVRAVREALASLLGVPVDEVTYDAVLAPSPDHAPGTWVHRGEPVAEAVQAEAGRLADDYGDDPPDPRDDDGALGW